MISEVMAGSFLVHLPSWAVAGFLMVLPSCAVAGVEVDFLQLMAGEEEVDFFPETADVEVEERLIYEGRRGSPELHLVRTLCTASPTR